MLTINKLAIISNFRFGFFDFVNIIELQARRKNIEKI